MEFSVQGSTRKYTTTTIEEVEEASGAANTTNAGG